MERRKERGKYSKNEDQTYNSPSLLYSSLPLTRKASVTCAHDVPVYVKGQKVTKYFHGRVFEVGASTQKMTLGIRRTEMC